MTPAPLQTVSEYIALQPKPVQTVLRKVRGALRKALPGAREVISYQIPALGPNDRNVVIARFAKLRAQEMASVAPKKSQAAKR